MHRITGGLVVNEAWTLRTLLHDLAARGDHPAVMMVRGEAIETLSYGRLADQAGRLAAGLLKAGVAPGEAIGLMGPNLPAWIVARVAIGAAGAVAAPFDDLSTAAEATALIRDSGCRFLFTTPSHARALREAGVGPEIRIYALDDAAARDGDAPVWLTLLADAPDALPPLGGEAPAGLIYTSGTTGPPKSFLLSYANFAANLEPLLARKLMTPQDRVLLPLPLHHVYPFLMGVLLPLASGATIVLTDAATGPKLLGALRQARVTAIIGVPRLYAALLRGLAGRIEARGFGAGPVFRALLALSVWLQRRLNIRVGRYLFRGLHRQVGPRLRRLVSGGAHLEPELAWKLEGLGWEVYGGYGLAETASVFTGNLPGRKRLDSDGLPLGGGRLRIADPDAAGIGEIQLRGPSVFAGYRSDPEANRAAFTDDEWFRTGDLGFLDADGYLHFTARAKEMIVLGGAKNVSPEELEKFYGRSPYIQEIAVLERNGTLAALVLPNLAAIQEAGIKRFEDALRVEITALSQQLPTYQRLSGFAIVRDSLPRTRLGKYKRFLLPQIYERASKGGYAAPPPPLSEEDKALLAGGAARKVWEYLIGRYGERMVRLDASPQLDLGVDSLEWMTITLELQGRFGISLDEADIAGIVTVRDLLRAAAAAPAAARAGPPEPARDQFRWLQPPGAVLRALGAVLYGFNWLAMRLFFTLEVEGARHLPRRGPYMIVANHASDLDPFAVAASLPPALIHAVYWGGEVVRLFSNAVGRTVCRAAHIFPVDERAPASSLALAAAVLERGNILIWFPEAWRSPTGDLQTFLPGVGMLVSDSKVRVVPAFIQGTFEAMPRGRRMPRLRPVRVRFGRPLDPRELGVAEGRAPDYSEIADSLRAAVAKLATPSPAGA